MSDENDSSTWEVAVSKRPLTDDDRIAARALTGFGFWFGPVLLVGAFIFVIGLTLLGQVDKLLGGILIAGFGVTACLVAIARLRQYERVRNDLAGGIVTVLKGAPASVYADRATGFVYVRLAGVDGDIRVPNDLFHELQEANSVEIAILPSSMLAVEVHIEHGLGLRLGAS